jgi:hypothetical protein
MKWSYYILTILFITVGCSIPERQNDQPVNDKQTGVIEEMLLGYYEDMSARDWEKYRTYFWDNATITTVWQQPGDTVSRVHIITIDDFIKETPHGPDSQPVFEEKMTGSVINVKGNIAEVWADYDAKFGKPDSLMQWSGTDVFTWLHHQGEWKIVSLVFEAASGQ